MSDFDAEHYLSVCSELDDFDLDLGKASVAMVSPFHEGVSLGRYYNHFITLKNEVQARYGELIDQGADDDAGVRLAALKHVLYDMHEYSCDDDFCETLDSVDILRVIDRSQGHSAVLAVLYMDVSRQLGWKIEGLDFPNRFLCRLSHGGQPIIFDPACPLQILEAHDLRAIVKDVLGEEAELYSSYYDGGGARGLIIRVSDLLKTRYIEMEDYERALSVVVRMRVFAPHEDRLLLDAGVLSMRIGEKVAAKEYLSSYIDLTPNAVDRDEVCLLLKELVYIVIKRLYFLIRPFVFRVRKECFICSLVKL